MTIERKCVISLGDIKAVCFECTACGARLTLSPDKTAGPAGGSAIPRTCPHCGTQWIPPGGPRIEQQAALAPEEFVTALRKLTDPNGRTYGFMILLEVDQLDSAR